MTHFFIPQEEDFRRWVRESVKAEIQEILATQKTLLKVEDEPLLSRLDMSRELNISLVTLTDWMKKGFPYLRMNGRVYFRRSEVISAMYHSKPKKNKSQEDDGKK